MSAPALSAQVAGHLSEEERTRMVVAGVHGLLEFDCCARCGAIPCARGGT